MAEDELTGNELVDVLVKENLIMKKKLKFLQEQVLPKAAIALQGQYKAWCELESITQDAMVTVTTLLENKDAFWPE